MTPFTNGSVGKPGALASDMHTQTVQRGDVRFVMSRSELVRFDLCPAKWITSHGETQSDEMLWGSLVDCLALTPEDFDARYVVAPQTYTTTGMQCPSCKSVTDSLKCSKCKTDRVKIQIEKEWNANAQACSDWILAQNGKTVIKHEMMTRAGQALKEIRNVVADLIDFSKLQVPVHAEYSDHATGIVIEVQGLIDIVPPVRLPKLNHLVDLKTAGCELTQRNWARQIHKDSLHVQAAMYMDLWEAATGEERKNFGHVAQESFAPYHVELKRVADGFIETGREKYQRALLKYCQCLKTNQWPGYEAIAVFDGWKNVEPEAYML